jgi:hypothetical protein
LLFLFFWIVYSVAGNVIYKRILVWLHFILTACPVFIITGPFLARHGRYLSFDYGYLDFSSDFSDRTTGIALIVLAFSQLIFLTNMIIGIIGKLMRTQFN